ncbi:MAG: hypothetical protein C4293_15775 [Nitrospiraceae bacterium]
MERESYRAMHWVSAALLIAIPCLLALLAYDAIAVFVFKRGPYQLVPIYELVRGMIQDVGLTVVYAATVTPRVMGIVTGYPERTRRLCLMMLGLGIAWYEVICAWATRLSKTPPDAWVSIVVLFVVPIILAPWYVRWLRSKVPHT